MNPVIYDLLLVSLSALLSWFLTHRYYLKSLAAQETELSNELEKLTKSLNSSNSNDTTLIKQQYITEAVDAWKRVGQAEHYLNSLTDISDDLKADIFRSACLRHKGREPKRNPFLKR